MLNPLMWKSEINIIKKIFLGYTNNNKKLNILEWGSGGSTIYFSSFLDNINADYSWTSIEGTLLWYNKVLAKVSAKKNIYIYYVPLPKRKEEYVDLPSTLDNNKYDIILVDGRHRRQCLLIASKLIDKCGVLILHDANIEDYYRGILDNFPYSKIFLCGNKNEKVCIGYFQENNRFLKAVFEERYDQRTANRIKSIHK